MLGSISTLAIVTGLVMSFVAGVFCHWKLLALIGGVSPALLVIFLYFMPETPIWLLRKKHRREALDSLVWLRGSDIDTDIEKEGLKVEVIIDIIGKRLYFSGYILLMTSLSLSQKYLGHFHCTLYTSFSSVLLSLPVLFIAVNSLNLAGLDPV